MHIITHYITKTKTITGIIPNVVIYVTRKLLCKLEDSTPTTYNIHIHIYLYTYRVVDKRKLENLKRKYIEYVYMYRVCICIYTKPI